jgi:hypothetical protein
MNAALRSAVIDSQHTGIATRKVKRKAPSTAALVSLMGVLALKQTTSRARGAMYQHPSALTQEK